MTLTQANRLLHFSCTLGTDVLLLTAFSGTEQFNQLFSYQLELISDTPNIQPKQLVGTPVRWSVQRADGSRRHWHGYVNQMALGDTEDGRRNYRLTVVPWLWFLTQTSDCKIFQDKTVPDIIKAVLGDYGFADYTPDFKGEHKKWEYCVQYRETDFNFISRLMEQEGIYYYFKHSDGAHKLIMADHSGAYYSLPESKVDLPTDIGGGAVTDHLNTWERRFEFVAGKYAQQDYNFETPSTDLKSEVKGLVDLPNITDYEIYDYPGEYPNLGDGKTETKLRMEAEEAQYELVEATSVCKTFQVGGKFKVGHHPDPAERDKAEVVISAIHHAGNEPMGYEGGSSAAGFDYRNSITCLPSSRIFRPVRSTPKPIISGIQTAIVTGPAGEEIYPDEHGRVKCQFHWDRYGKKDDKSSCWIRVSQNHAGPGFGGVYLPRINEEVVVSFLEGDPDRPLITGRVYHAENKPVYPLPDHKTRNTFRTRSSKGGEGFNELTFEDKKGDERLYLQAQKNMDVRVLNDSKERIYGNRHQIIGWEQDGKKGGDQRERVWEDKHQNVKKDLVRHVEGNSMLTVGHGDAESGGNVDIKIEKQKTETIGAGSDLTVAGPVNQKIDGPLSMTIGGNHHSKVGGDVAVEAGPANEIHLKAGMKVIIEAGMQISIVGPGGFIDIGPAGVTIQGIMVKINSGGAAGKGKGCKPKEPKEAKQAKPTEPQTSWKPENA